MTTVEKKKDSESGLTAGGKVSTLKVDRDGTWTFSIVAEDLAGNVTAVPASVSFIRDATPPKPVSFEVRAPDGSLLLAAPPAPPDHRDAHSHQLDTNSFTVRWLPSGDKDIVGYTYNLQPGWATLADYEQSRVPLLAPPARVVTSGTELSFANKDNGVYVLTVQALDGAGNISPPSTIALELEHYQVVTRVDLVTTQKDPVIGSVKVTIIGRGFRDNGPISRVYLDRVHRGPPWDIEFDPAQQLSVTDREISGIVLDDNRESGSYRVGLLQKRPTGQDVLYFTPEAMFDFRSPGTVKVGNFQVVLPRWIAGPSPRYIFSFDGLLVVLVVALLGSLSILAFRKILALAQEGVAVRAEVAALLEGRPNAHWEERKKRMQTLKKKGIGLRLKFTLLMVILVTMIVLIVSIPLGFQMVSKQRTSLATGLQSSANILLGALASSAESQFRLQDEGLGAAQDMLNLRSTMAEAISTTITGPDRNYRPTDPKDVVWASDEKRFDDELKAGRFNRAAEMVGDQLAKSVIPALQKKIDSDGAAKLATLVDDYRNLKGQQVNLTGKADAASKAQLAIVNDKLAAAGREIDTQAKSLYAASSTLEPFNPNARLRPSYLFYKPVIFYNRAPNLADTTFYQGMIRLQVKTDTINRQIDDSISGIITSAGIVALIAIALGILGAVIMASITVTPIRRLARGVAIIRDTEDKEQLKSHSIEVGTRDEIGSLAETVNEMTQGLVKAAVANKELLQGIDVQKRFLPLVKDKAGGETSTAGEENARMEIFGYYKGAKGVSGDYFDFRRLDDTYYALIKCDVSGKGVSAALIMVEVATLFINYFRDWPKRKENIARITDPKVKQRALRELERLDPLVYTINDMVEERGFVGRFAALTVLLYNSATGVATLCNAGDTVLNVYRAEKKDIVHAQLPDSPAAGMFPSMLVDMKTPYKQVQQQLVPGDVLFMATDGFEDAEHLFRDADFQGIMCSEPGLGEKEHHRANLGDHEVGLPLERFGMPREDELINAVFNRGRFVLVRNHNAIPSEELVFDFSACTGTAQDVVLALVAVDRVYRMVPDPRLGAENKITVEANVVAFLKEHFLQYERYFSPGGWREGIEHCHLHARHGRQPVRRSHDPRAASEMRRTNEQETGLCGCGRFHLRPGIRTGPLRDAPEPGGLDILLCHRSEGARGPQHREPPAGKQGGGLLFPVGPGGDLCHARPAGRSEARRPSGRHACARGFFRAARRGHVPGPRHRPPVRQQRRGAFLCRICKPRAAERAPRDRKARPVRPSRINPGNGGGGRPGRWHNGRRDHGGRGDGGSGRTGTAGHRDILSDIRPRRVHAREQRELHGAANLAIAILEADGHEDRFGPGHRRRFRHEARLERPRWVCSFRFLFPVHVRCAGGRERKPRDT